MIIPNRRRYKKRYVIGGSGIFDTVANFFKRLVVSDTAKQIASKAMSAGKDVAKEIGKKAVDVGKTVAIDAGAKLVDKVVKKLLAPKLSKIPAPVTLSRKNKDVLTRLINDASVNKVVVDDEAPTSNINNLMMGSGGGGAISIQDLVQKLSNVGGGLKLAR